MLRRAQYLLIALFGLWVIALLYPRTGLANTLVTDPIAVTNPSFESASGPWSGTADTGLYNFSIDGWNTTGSDGTWTPNLSHTPQYFTPPQVPDGANVAWSNGGVIYQTLSVTLAATDTYTLTVYVGHRNDAWPTVPFPNYPYYIGIYSGSTFTGTNVLDANYVQVSPGQWKAVTLTYTPTNGDPVGEPLGIFLYSAGTQVDFDKVSLTRTFEVVPIPASVLLLGTGLLGLGLPRFRREKIS
jgi:hypothetical protein